MKKPAAGLLLALIVVVLGGAYYAYQHGYAPVPAPEPVAAVGPEVAALPPIPADNAAAPVAPVPEPAIRHPIESAEAPVAAPSADDPQDRVVAAVTELVGRKNVLTFLQVDELVRRVVATVDNLARSHAPLTLWPVNPAPGRFITTDPAPATPGETLIGADNSLRYAPLVIFLESVDTARAVAFYTRLYPLFQTAYEELGFPGRYFNDRLVAVIDVLLSTPTPANPLRVTLVEVKGSVPSVRPWVRYEFSDPALQSLTAGQKMLLRTGEVNQRRLTAKLREIRAAITRTGAAPPAPAAPARP
ncbi:MAG: DUF3014 domain-containing protein [Betaproteobacteria bacterium HGW-Betaproteobacteria-3]|jgi:hypothetical protein|nr:MAG: DUF3014 domain-containing protein [Betaproteobacteria bacterium HGW-Betaproteobacteria-3]